MNKMQRAGMLVFWMLAMGSTALPAEAPGPPLVLAAGENQVDRVKDLLRAGADPNGATSSGWTPLMAAVAGGRKEAALVLLEAGADPDARDRLGRTPLDVAQKAGQADLVRLLRGRGARGSGKSLNDTVCVQRWSGAGFCGAIERIEGNRYLVGVTRVEGCEDGCAADAACSGGEPVTRGSLGRRVWIPSSCLTRTYPGSGRR